MNFWENTLGSDRRASGRPFHTKGPTTEKARLCMVEVDESIHPSVRPSVRPSIHPSIHPSIYLSIYSSIYWSIHPTNRPNTYLSTNPFIYPSMHPCIHPSIYPFSLTQPINEATNQPLIHPSKPSTLSSLRFHI